MRSLPLSPTSREPPSSPKPQASTAWRSIPPTATCSISSSSPRPISVRTVLEAISRTAIGSSERSSKRRATPGRRTGWACVSPPTDHSTIWVHRIIARPSSTRRSSCMLWIWPTCMWLTGWLSASISSVSRSRSTKLVRFTQEPSSPAAVTPTRLQRRPSVAALLTWSPSADRSSTTRTFLHASPMAGPSTTI